MDRYARSWMSFLQTNVCTSERTAHAPSQMLQVAGRGYAELLRTPFWRRSHNAASRLLDQASSTLPHPPKPGDIAQTLNARGFAYATCCTLQPLLARGESTADTALDTKSGVSRLYGFCR